ncbi:hypothetical protein SFC43_12195 [Bacteroides sp. CR5/BHMF/2]|nr:hypothetical protein [Bacteroides sp. CR5/BHMF/2]
MVLESDSVNGGFVEQPYNPVSLKVGGFIGGAGHSCVFKDKYENWWQVTSMWVGNHDEFERRIGLFPVSFDDKGRMRTHTVLGIIPYHYRKEIQSSRYFRFWLDAPIIS